MRAVSSTATDQTEAQRRRRLKVLGNAIRSARGDLPQADLGVLLGDIPQTTISRWERGMVELSVEQIRSIERVLKLEPGRLLHDSGYAPGIVTHDLVGALRADESLHPDVRADVVRMYRNYQEMSAGMFEAERPRRPPARAKAKSPSRR